MVHPYRHGDQCLLGIFHHANRLEQVAIQDRGDRAFCLATSLFTGPDQTLYPPPLTLSQKCWRLLLPR